MKKINLNIILCCCILLLSCLGDDFNIFVDSTNSKKHQFVGGFDHGHAYADRSTKNKKAIINFQLISSESQEIFDVLYVSVDKNLLDNIGQNKQLFKYDLAKKDKNEKIQVFAAAGCQRDSDNCHSVFQPKTGFLTVKVNESLKNPIELNFEKLVLTGNVNGQLSTWRLETLAKDIFVISSDLYQKLQWPVANTPQNSCVNTGTGRELGDNIANFSLINCLGNKINLHDHCGSTKALQLAPFSLKNTASVKYVKERELLLRQWQKKGYQIWYLLINDEAQYQVNLPYCLQVANKLGLNPANVFIGDENEQAFMIVLQYMEKYSFSDNINLPFSILLDGSNMSYLYSTNACPNNIDDLVTNLLK